LLPVLTHLTCASLTEDTYGTVQKDIPRILEALLTFLSAVEEYQAEIDAKYNVQPLTSDEVEKLPRKEVERRVAMEIEVGKAGEMLGDISGGMFRFTSIDQSRRGSTFAD
jgi:nucleoporin NDC1